MLNWYRDITKDNFDNLDGYSPHTVYPDCPGTGNSVQKITKKVGIMSEQCYYGEGELRTSIR